MRHVMTSRFLAGVVSLAVTVGIIIGGVTASLATSEGQPVPPAVITEDMPEWDCTTMGNRTCGPSVDLSDPFTRCLDAVDGAHLPGWMWECHETPPPVIAPQQ